MMGEILEIKRKDGVILQGQFKLLEEKDIKDIMRLQKIVIDALEDKQLFAPSEEEEFLLYIKELGIGIRIEDDILVTDDGSYVLSGKIIKEIDEIEKAMESI